MQHRGQDQCPAAGDDEGAANDSNTVAVVDASVVCANVTRCALESVGLRVLHFTSARRFLDSTAIVQVDCVVSETCLPGISGLELLRAMHANPAAPAVLFVTAEGRVRVAVEAMRQGAVDYLQKPVSARRLIISVQQALSVSRRRREQQGARLGAGMVFPA